jgi:hypothetical protein
VKRFNHLIVEVNDETRKKAVWGFFATIVQEGRVHVEGCDVLARYLDLDINEVVAGVAALCTPHIDDGVRKELHDRLAEELSPWDLQFAGQFEPDETKNVPHWLLTPGDGRLVVDTWKEAILVPRSGPAVWKIESYPSQFSLFMRDLEHNQWNKVATVATGALQRLTAMIGAPELTHENNTL